MIRALLLTGLLTAAPAALAAECPAAPGRTAMQGALPHVQQAAAANAPVKILIVGLGGAKAGGFEGAFAAKLAAALEAQAPGALKAQIVSAPGLLAKESAERLKRAVAEAGPTLVIWRTGMADALTMTEPAKFGHVVRTTAEWVAQQNADLLLVDLPYRGSAKEEKYRLYVDELAALGRTGYAAVFPRYAVMEAWERKRQVLEPAQLDHCLAHLLAAGIAAATPR